MNFLTETIQARRQRNDIFRMLKEKIINPEFHIQQEYLSRTEGKIKIFSRKTKLIIFNGSRPVCCMIRNAEGSSLDRRNKI